MKTMKTLGGPLMGAAATLPARILCPAVFAAALLLMPSSVSAQSAPATDDAVIQLSSPTTNNGSSSNLRVGGPNLQEALAAVAVNRKVYASGRVGLTGYLNTARPGVSDPRRMKLVENYGELPLSFAANQGETDGRVRFLSRGPGYSLFLANSEAVLSLGGPAKGRASKSDMSRRNGGAAPDTNRGAVLRMRLLGSNPAPEATGLEEMPGKSNYFIGDDPNQWRTNVPTYAKVRYADVYPGVDLVYYGNQRQLEYDFVVAPGTDPSAITLSLVGADRMQIDQTGELVLQTRAGEVRWHKPVVYQEVGGKRQMVDGRFVRKSKRAVGFAVGAYDPNRKLIIDPVLVYSTYLGGTLSDYPFGIAVDSAGNAYITGWTNSTDFPTAGAIQSSFGGSSSDCFVTKLNAAGNALVYSTYLGGTGGDEALAIAVDSVGNAYVTGDTASANFPKVSAFQTTLRGAGNAFVSKLNAAGNALLYSTYFGGSANLELGYGIAVDSAGNAYLVGTTDAANFPTKNALQAAYGGNHDGFVAKLNTTLSGNASLVYSTYLGGANLDYARAIVVDASGNAYVTGVTFSANFPVSAGAFQTALAGGGDAFVTKLNATGNAALYSTYLGGSGAFTIDQGLGIAVDASGNAYVTGDTSSTDFPTLNGFQTTFGGGSANAFVTKLNAAGSALLYSTYLGGNNGAHGAGIAVDAAGYIYVAGSTASSNFPTVNAIQSTMHSFDAFVAKLNTTASGSASLLYSSFLGGSAEEDGSGIAVDPSGDVYVTGTTFSTDFPTVNPYQSTLSGGAADAFVTKIHFEPAATLDSISVTPANPTIAVGATQQFTAIKTFSDSSTQDVTNSVTWSSATPGVAAIMAGGLASSISTGTSVITATSGGISGSTTLTVFNPQAFDYTLSASPASLALIASTSKSSTITLRSQNGTSEMVRLTADWLGLGSAPTGATIAIVPSQVSVPSSVSASATLMLTTSASTSPGTFGLRVTGTSISGVTKVLDLTVVIAGNGSGGGGNGGGGSSPPTCGCSKTGAFVDPNIEGLVQTSPFATVTTSSNQLTLSRNSDSRMIINGASIINGATFGFSPNGKFFVLVSSASLTLYSVDRAAAVGPHDVLNALSWGFSPDDGNRFFMLTSSTSVNTHAVIDIYDTGTGANVMEESAFYSTVPAWTDESGVGDNKTVGGMGFSPDGHTFVLSYKTGSTSYLLGLWNLTRTNSPIRGETRLDVASFWQFSPCGDLFMLVSQAGASLAPSDTVQFLNTSNGQPYKQATIDLSRGAPSATVVSNSNGSKQVQLTGMSLTSFASPQCAAGQPPTNLPAPTCGCIKTGAFVDPRVEGLVPTSPFATVTTSSNQFTLTRNSDGHVIVNSASNVFAFGFSPNGKFFVLITSPTSLTLYSVDRAAAVGPRDVSNPLSWGFSPDDDNRFFLVTTSTSVNTHAVIDIYDTGTGANVMEHSALYSAVPAWTEESNVDTNTKAVGGLGFSPDGHTFLLSYKTGPTSYLLGLWNLTHINFPILGETRLDVAAFWQFSPCGDLLMLVSQAGANLAPSDTVQFLYTSNGLPYKQATIDLSRGSPSATVVTNADGSKGIQLTGMSLTSILSPQCTVSVTAHSPVNIVLMDENARRTGFDPATGGLVNEIPGGSYTGVSSEPQTVAVPYVAGAYLAVAFGLESLTSPQPYTLTFAATDGSGDIFDQANVSAMASRGSEDIFAFSIGNGPITPQVGPAASQPLTITANNATQTYGTATPTFGVTYNGFLNGDSAGSLGGTLRCTTTATPGSPVGMYPITCAGQTSSTYAITYAPGTLTITPAPLTIAANSVSRPYGASNPLLTGTVMGLQNADPISVSFTTTAGPASLVGNYPITAAVFDPSNRLGSYSLSLINGTLMVVQERTTLSVTLSPLSIIVGQSSLATVTLTAPDMVIPIDPSVLAPMLLSSPVVSDILSNNGMCTPVPSAAPGVVSCTFAVTAVEPNGRTLNASFAGSPDLAASSASGDLIVTAALESQKSCLNSDFRNVAVPGGSYLWFNSIFKVKDVTKHRITITFFQSSVQFQYKDTSQHVVTVNQAMPDAKIVIDPSVTTASTTFDAINNVWITTVPFDLDDAAFLTGLPWLVPAGGIPGDIEPVTFCGTFASDTAGVDIGWRWAAAAYSSFSSDNSVLGVKPMFTDHDNPGTNRDLAGTPENFKQFVIPGARGRGGKNYTGTYSRSAFIE
jgi:hypothetical protein